MGLLSPSIKTMVIQHEFNYIAREISVFDGCLDEVMKKVELRTFKPDDFIHK